MRNSIKVAAVVLFLGAFAISVLHQKSAKNVDLSDRTPSSIPVKALDDSIVVPANAEITAYHFERNVLAEIKDKTTKPILNLDMHGTVFLTELSHTDDTRLVGVQFELVQGNENEEHDSHLPFVVELTKGQNIQSIRISKTLDKLDEDDANVLKDFVSLYAYGVNRDTTGTYQFKLDRDGNDVQKTKIKYDSAALQTIAILSSNTQGDVDPVKGTWLKVQGKEQTRMDGMGNGQLITTSLFKIEKLNGKLKPKMAIRSFIALQDTNLDLISHREFAAKPWSELKARLANIKTLTRTQRLALFHDLSKLLKMDPEAVLEFRKYIEAMSKEPGLMTFGIGVLATAGTDVAQATLRDWYQGGYGVEHTVLNAFSTANAELNDETRTFLKGILAQHDSQAALAQNAAYALGSSLKHSNDDGARTALNSFYTGSQNEADKLTALDAMGNSGDDHFIPTLKIAAQSTNPAEREKAVFGARFLAPDAAAPLLMAGYQDGTLAVQNASIRALAFQENLAPHAPLIRACASAGNGACQSMLKQLNQ